MRRLLSLLVLMVAACSSQVDTPIVPEARNIGTIKTVFMGTTRDVTPVGGFGIGRAENLSLLQVDVSIPPQRAMGTVSDGRAVPDPYRDFVLARRTDYDNGARFERELASAVRSKGSKEREVTVFVHGFNNSFNDAAFRIAQLAHDLQLPGNIVSYAWSSRGHPLGYEYDRDSALFARDGLEELLRRVAASGNPRIVIVAHSMGGALVMEALRQIEIADHGWTGRNVSGVILMSPDLNPEVFRSQIRTFKTVPDPFVVFVSRNDLVLTLSARIRGEEQRLGNLRDESQIKDLPVTIVDVSAFSDRKSGNHFVAAGSPALIQLLRGTQRIDREFLRGDPRGSKGLPSQRRIIRGATQIILLPIGGR